MPASEQRSSGQGTKFDATLVRDFIKTTLSHDPVADLVYELLAEQVRLGLTDPAALTGSLRPLIDEVLGAATPEDWDLISSSVLTDAKEGLSAPLVGTGTPLTG